VTGVRNKQVLAILVFLVVVSTFLLVKNKSKSERVVFPDLGVGFEVEIAKTEKQRMLGLMYRPFLAINSGMLFIFEQEQIQKVWMKNTLIALDVVFISDNGFVVSVIQSMMPCNKEPCEIYSSDNKARYMLELNAEVVKRKGIKVGQKIIFE